MDERAACDVSLVCTVLNEAGTIGDLMASIAAQSIRPCEVIVVDGGSRDGTQLHVEWWHGRLGCPLRIIERPGVNIATGRNIGIAMSRAPVIAMTDAGVRLEKNWLERLCAPFADPSVDVCGGFFVPDARTPFEAALGATVLPSVEEIVPSRFLPSSRSVAFRKAAWQAAGGYPEWLDFCEDIVFDLALRERGAQRIFSPEAVVWFRPRGGLRSFWHQYFHYARGDGKAHLWSKRHAIRYVTYSALAALAALGKRGRWLWPLVAVAGSCYVQRPYRRLAPALASMTPAQRLCAITLVPVIRAVGDGAKMCGYPVGVLWRVRRHRFGWTWRDVTDVASTKQGVAAQR